MAFYEVRKRSIRRRIRAQEPGEHRGCFGTVDRYLGFGKEDRILNAFSSEGIGQLEPFTPSECLGRYELRGATIAACRKKALEEG